MPPPAQRPSQYVVLHGLKRSTEFNGSYARVLASSPGKYRVMLSPKGRHPRKVLDVRTENARLKSSDELRALPFEESLVCRNCKRVELFVTDFWATADWRCRGLYWLCPQCPREPDRPGSKRGGIIYLTKPAKFIRNGEPIYKLGQSIFHDQRRLAQYEQGSRVIICAGVADSLDAERELKKKFTETFVQERDEGTEFFRGDVSTMIQCFSNVARIHLPAP